MKAKSLCTEPNIYCIIQSFSIGLMFFSFHLTDVAIHLTYVSLQLMDISLQLTEAQYKFEVHLKQNLKAENKPFSAHFVFECFPSLSLHKGPLFRR